MLGDDQPVRHLLGVQEGPIGVMVHRAPEDQGVIPLVARVAGETAPLLFTAFSNRYGVTL